MQTDLVIPMGGFKLRVPRTLELVPHLALRGIYLRRRVLEGPEKRELPALFHGGGLLGTLRHGADLQTSQVSSSEQLLRAPCAYRSVMA